MSYLTPVDQTVLLAIWIGLASGTASSCIDAALSQWVEKTWHGWNSVMTSVVLSAVIFGLIFGAIAFLMALYNPAKPVSEINQLIFKAGVSIGLTCPFINRLGKLVVDQLFPAQK